MARNGNDDPDPPDEQGDRPADCRATDTGMAADVSISPSVLFGVLADARQRRILYYLVENGGTWTLEAIGKHLAAWENETTVEPTTEEMQNRVTAGMHHADVPKLEDYGFIEYDPETGRMTYTEQTEEIVPLLELAEQLEGDDFETHLEQAHPQPSQDSTRQRE